MPADNLDDESTLGLAFSILNRDITSFNSSVLLPGWVNHPTLED
jgi:hypothetical protein